MRSAAAFDRRVSASFASSAAYPERAPYHPAEGYPEYPFEGELSSEPNLAYGTVRESLALLGLDRNNFGTKQWNPLGEIIRPGDAVLLKPNFIKESHSEKRDEWVQIITHGSVIRAVADYVYLALGGQGRIIVADGPQTDSNFDKICQRLGIRKLQSFYQVRAGFNLEVYDLRNEHWTEQDGVYTGRNRLSGDPLGTVMVDLAGKSHFAVRETKGRFYGAFYDVEETNKHHSNGHHRYAFCRSPLAADVVVHIPKLKTHKKCGITVSLKGLVGLNGNKNLLPHYCFGAPEDGGDQFPGVSAKHKVENLLVTGWKKYLLQESSWALFMARKLKRQAYRVFGSTSEVVRSGNWYKNDTIWRAALDLNAILTFADQNGVLHDTPQRRFFSVVDGIVAGEGNGPMEATPKACGMIVAGASPVLVDAICARLMGFDYRKIPLIANAFSKNHWSFAPCECAEIDFRSSSPHLDSSLLQDGNQVAFQFEPHFGWKNHIELES